MSPAPTDPASQPLPVDFCLFGLGFAGPKGTQGRHESVGVLFADNVNQGILEHRGTSLGNHSFRPDIEDYGNTRLKINGLLSSSPTCRPILRIFKKDPGSQRLFALDNLNPPGGRGPVYEFCGVTKAWQFTEEKMLQLL